MTSGQPPLPLRDLHLPPAPEAWPPAPGWWVLSLLAVMLLIWAGFALYRHRRVRRARAQILQTLEALDGEYPRAEQTAQFLAQVSVLLRRVAVTRFSRRRVARLTGRDWLLFLDDTGGGGRFCGGPGRVLAYGPYQPQVSGDRAELLALAREWIVRNTDGRHPYRETDGDGD